MNLAVKNKSNIRTLFNVILSVAILVQGVMFSQLVQCGDSHLSSDSHQMADSHAGHMAGMDMSGMDAGEGHQASALHICPMGGCYECPPDECGQCSTAKLAVLVAGIDASQPHYVFLNHYVDRAPARLELDVLRLLPPGRAPPLNV